jgi:hypothetical protein
LLPLSLSASGVLYEGIGGWGAVTGAAEEEVPPGPEWQWMDGVWMGRLPDQADHLALGGTVFPLADARPVGFVPAALPGRHNPFGACILHSLSVRFNGMIDKLPWTPQFSKAEEPPSFLPVGVTGGERLSLMLELEDAATGQRWPLEPTFAARDGGLLARGQRTLRFYSGSVEDGELEWAVVTSIPKAGDWMLQGRIVAMKSPFRLLRWRIGLRREAEAHPVDRMDWEGAVGIVSHADATAVSLVADLGEPRRMRAVRRAEATGLEFDLAVTPATRNFPRLATVSVKVESWASESAEAARREAVERLPRAGGALEIPADDWPGLLAGALELTPSAVGWTHPGGFRDARDAWNYLWFRISDLFPPHPVWMSAFACMARNADGIPLISLNAERAEAVVNPDPDLEISLERGPNQGKSLLAATRAPGVRAVWVRASENEVLDYAPEALRMCDYPAVWDPKVGDPAVDIRHAEAEWLAALACDLKKRGIPLLVSDAGSLASFTLFHADGLVCASADPEEMKRQRVLAGDRPVLWNAADPSAEAEQLAQELGFDRISP